jgi:hypothetical protein
VLFVISSIRGWKRPGYHPRALLRAKPREPPPTFDSDPGVRGKSAAWCKSDPAN